VAAAIVIDSSLIITIVMGLIGVPSLVKLINDTYQWQRHVRLVQNIHDLTFWPTEITQHQIKYVTPVEIEVRVNGKLVAKSSKKESKTTLSLFQPAVTMRFAIVNPNEFPEVVKDMTLTITHHDDKRSYALRPIYFGRDGVQTDSEVPPPLQFEKFIEEIVIKPRYIGDSHQVVFVDNLVLSPPPSGFFSKIRNPNDKRLKNDDDITPGRYECSLKFTYDAKFIPKSRRIKFKFDLTEDEIKNFLTNNDPIRVNRSQQMV
jgi:hypothetical protein